MFVEDVKKTAATTTAFAAKLPGREREAAAVI